MIKPDYIFESSWEVCNKVGGIYAVLSTRAKTLQDAMPDHIIFIGPDCWKNHESPFFKEDKALMADWQKVAKAEGLQVRVGRWDIPGQPVSILVDFDQYYAQKEHIYGVLWEHYQVDSLHGYGDYDEASMFSYAAAKVVESIYKYKKLEDKKVIYHGNEWMTGLGLLYVNHYLPKIGTIFTTHATSIGRSIAGNNKPLYEYLWAYNGNQMADELNMQSKHSIEHQTAWNVDCFTTVSEITAKECAELIDKPVDVVLPNGFENDFVPTGAKFTAKRNAARKQLLKVANCLTGKTFGKDTLIIGTSGRYEFRNKGLDVFVESMVRLSHEENLQKDILAFVEVPAWVAGPRQDLQERLTSGKTFDTPLDQPVTTHWLHNMDEDKLLGMMRYNNMNNARESKVTLIFVPCYLVGDDGIFNMPYYDVIIGKDLCIYPSYYEPWGYTPLEAVAFKVPCITTDLAGFGLWANSVKGAYSEITDGVKTVHRTDYNYSEVADSIKDTVMQFAAFDDATVKKCRTAADKISKKALWDKFIAYYWQAYDCALSKK